MRPIVIWIAIVSNEFRVSKRKTNPRGRPRRFTDVSADGVGARIDMFGHEKRFLGVTKRAAPARIDRRYS